MNDRSSPNGFGDYPLFWVAAAFASGIFIERIALFPWRVPLAVSIVAIAFSLMLRRSRFFLALLVASFVFAGIASMGWRSEVRSDRLSRLIDGGVVGDLDPIELFGTVQDDPEPTVEGMFVNVDASRAVHKGREFGASGVVRLFLVASDEGRLTAFSSMGIGKGAEVTATFRIRRGDRFLNPGIPKSKDLLAQKGLDATGTVKSPLLFRVLSPPERVSGLSPARVRNWMIGEFRERLSPQAAGVMAASLLGDKYFLDKATADLFREGGTFHVLVISGLHITFIGGLILWFASAATKNLWIQFTASSSMLWLFALAVGGEVPVVRAAVMFTVMLFLRAIRRDASAMNSFGASALAVLVWRPEDLFTPSFVLTFVSTGAIVSIAVPFVSSIRAIGRWMPTKKTPLPPNVGRVFRRFCETLYWRDEHWEFAQKRNAWTARIFKAPLFAGTSYLLRKLFAFLFEGVAVSAIVQICLLPFQIWYFHRVSTGGIVLNLLVELILAVESFAAVFSVLVAQASETFSAPFVAFTDLLNRALLASHRIFTDGAIASMRVPVYTFMRELTWLYMMPVAYFAARSVSWDPFVWGRGVDCLAARVARASRFAMASLLMVLNLMLVFHPYSAPSADGKLRIDFLDVGQGDSMLVTFPNGETMLVDGGGRAAFGSDEREDGFEPDVQGIGEAVVSQFLWEKGYSRIDYVLATHSDTDHMQGLTDVVGNFDVGRVFVARVASEDRKYIDLAGEISKKGLVPELVGRGDRFEIGGVSIDVLNPVYSPEAPAVYGNPESIVLSLQYGARRFLLTGDVEEEGEREMLARPESLRADLVKVAHHGSRTSSTDEFVDAVRAAYAVIPVGRTSPFGHPHEEVVDRWRRSGASVFKTGEKGTVTAETDGKSISVTTFLAKEM